MSCPTPGRQPAHLRRATVVVTASLLTVLTASGFAFADLKTDDAAVATAAAAVSPVPAPADPAAAAPAPAADVAPSVAEPPAAEGTVAATAEAATELLAPVADGLACAVVDALPLCTHGDHDGPSVAEGGTARSAPQTPVGCAGDGRSDNRIQVVYVHQADRPDRFGTVLPTLRREFNVANGVFHRSSDGRRQLRAVTDSQCNLAVERVTLSPAQAGSFGETTKALRAGGRNRLDRKYLVFMDNEAGCGLGEYYLDDRAQVGNRNNDGDMYAIAYNRCWNGVLVAHELTHLLGGVQPSAPRSTGNHGHCTDQHEVMCYRDGSGKAMTAPCAAAHATLLDCGRDDYFNVAPPAGSYLSRHWNTASSSFLLGGGPARPIAPSEPVGVASARTGENVSLSWGTPEQARTGLTAFDVVDLDASRQVLATVGGAARAATVTLTPWRTYRLAVVARNSAGSSAAAGGHLHVVGRAPAAPSNVLPLYTVEQTSARIRLSWTAPQHATSYLVLRDGRPVATTTTPAWTEPAALALGRQYTYTVEARNAWGASPLSEPRTATAL